MCDMRPILIPRCDGVGKPLKKIHTRSGGPGIRTRDLPSAKWRARRLATMLGCLSVALGHSFLYTPIGRLTIGAVLPLVLKISQSRPRVLFADLINLVVAIKIKCYSTCLTLKEYVFWHTDRFCCSENKQKPISARSFY
jgi:hypothetical protein